MYTVHYVVRVIIVRRPSDPSSRRPTAFFVCVYHLAGCLIQIHNCCRVLLGGYGIWWSFSLFLLRRTEFEDLCVVCSSKRVMEHWLWCVGHLIEAFG
jgi:hypothetical protein